MQKKILFTIFTVSLISACSGSSNSSGNASKQNTSVNNSPEPPVTTNNCIENGQYACKTGETEPLYPFQWALQYKESFFKNFKDIWKADSDPENYDLNVENLHKQGIKGQNINVIVLDDGIEIRHEDLLSNINTNMTYNFQNNSNDPTPLDNLENIDTAHGTNVAGIIAAAQNGKGIMGIAPRANLGGANLLKVTENNAIVEAYGGANFSKNADLFNASFGVNPKLPPSYNTNTSTPIFLRALTYLRNNKGALNIKASGNEFIEIFDNQNEKRDCPSQFKNIFSCENPAHDIEILELTTLSIAAANTRGVRAYYSNAGAINWVTGLAGESGEGGTFGEGTQNIPLLLRGPTIFSTDLQGCQRGYSRNILTEEISDNLFARGLSLFNGIKNNLQCNYSQMNGTSAATPTVSGVTALILQVNPNLTWRDVREILRQTSKVIDKNYATRIGANRLVDLTTGQLLSTTGTTNDIKDGMTQVPIEFGWQKNGAGIEFSNWYGFGLIDANAAGNLAKRYKAGTLQAPLQLPDFVNAFPATNNLTYGRVTKLGQISINSNTIVDQFQLRVTGPLCVGSVGFFVKSPSGVISSLSTPYNIYYKTSAPSVDHYGLGSYAFHGERTIGNWEVFAVSGDKGKCNSTITATTPLKVEYRIIPKAYS